MKHLAILLISCCFFSLCKSDNNPTGEEFREIVSEESKQNMLFTLLANLINKTPEQISRDSLSVLILPVEASCPSCRKKTIDSIAKYDEVMDEAHWVVVSGSNDKVIRSFFKAQGHPLPAGAQTRIDSTNAAFKHELIFSKPVIYTIYNRKVKTITGCVPRNIKSELAAFFQRARVNAM